MKVYSPFNIGDFVKIKDTGEQYSSYQNAFRYFWGNEQRAYIDSSNKDKYWKIINIAQHSNTIDLIYHIRSFNGENAVISGDGLELVPFHKRNRESIKPIIVYQIPHQTLEARSDWKDKLWDFYDEKKGKIIINTNRKEEIYKFKK